MHRLVRLSPFDPAHRRHTSFALVEVLPELEDEGRDRNQARRVSMISIGPRGAGGQNVQQDIDGGAADAHLPTGIVVTCQNERSQIQNRETAMKMLKSQAGRKGPRRTGRRAGARMKGEHGGTAWQRDRSYVLHPYQWSRTTARSHETCNTKAVLDGDLDGFIGRAYLRQKAI